MPLLAQEGRVSDPIKRGKGCRLKTKVAFLLLEEPSGLLSCDVEIRARSQKLWGRFVVINLIPLGGLFRGKKSHQEKGRNKLP